jgi:hypothetical protein
VGRHLLTSCDIDERAFVVQAWRVPRSWVAFAFLVVGTLAGCGLDRGGLNDGPDGSVAEDAGAPDVSVGTDGSATSGDSGTGGGGDSGGGPHPDAGGGGWDAAPTDAQIDALPPPPVDGGSCMKNPDCASSPAGTKCVQGVCGCNSTGDCPPGEACNGSHQCTTSCIGGLVCNGGCCDGFTCQPGNSNNSCGDKGAGCAPCSGQTPTCLGGTCTNGCGQPADGTCGTGFCCNMGQCAPNGQASACGASGQSCVDCTMSPDGHVCSVAQTCTCVTTSDCPSLSMCVLGTCSTACGPLTPCSNGGCCTGPTNGTCVAQCPMTGMGSNGMCQMGMCK